MADVALYRAARPALVARALRSARQACLQDCNRRRGALTAWRLRAGQGARYLLTGGAAAAVDIAGFALGLELGLPLIPAATLSFVAGTVVNYLLTARYVFGHARSLRGYLKFSAVATIGLVINVSLTALLATHTPLSAIAAKVVGIGVAFVFNFAINALVVFKSSQAD